MVKVMSDSTCDLSQELLERYDVDIIPLHIVLGDKEYRDRLEITPEEIYAWSDANKTTPKTSATAFEDAVEAFRPYVEAGREIVAFTISESMSTTANVFRMAAEELEAEDKITVIDSANLSTGIGLQVIEAAIMAKEGKSAKEIAEHMAELRPKVRASFVVDTLEYLRRGGRCSSVAAFAGGVLKLHPRIIVMNGAMSADKKYRGKYHNILLDYAKDLEENLRNAYTDRVFITHSGCNAEDVQTVKEYLEGLGIFQEIHITRAGGVISSHCGPATLGVLYILKEEKDTF